MAIVIREVLDEEVARACEIEAIAYKDNPIGSVIAPGPFPPDASQQRAQQLIASRKEDTTAHYIQAYDEAAGKMVAFAEWHIFETPEAVPVTVRPLVFGPGKNAEACLLFFSGMAERKRAIMGDKPHLCKFLEI
jgi:hypothetical protein